MKRLQYQGLSEPISREVERVNWQQPSNIPQSNWANDKIKKATFAAIVPCVFFVSTFTTEATTADRWHPQSNEPVRQVQHREYEYPSSFIDTTILTQPERPTLDKWHVDRPLPPEGATHHEYLYPSYTTDSNAVTQPESNIDRWIPQKPDKIWDIRRLQYSYPYNFIDTSILTQTEYVSYDRFRPEYPNKVWGKVHQEYIYPSFVVDPTQLTQKEAVSYDRYRPEYPERIFRIDHREYLMPSLWYDPLPITTPEDITLDKWYAPLSEPRMDVIRNRYLYPIGNELTNLFIVTQSPVDALFNQSDYVYRAKFIPYYYPYLAIDPYSIAQPESATIDRWLPQKPDYVWDKVHIEYIYPTLFIDSVLLTQAESTTVDKWYVQRFLPPAGAIHKEYQYPSLFFDSKVIINPVSIDGNRVHVIYPVTYQYQKFAEPLEPSLRAVPESITLDKWFNPLAEPQRDVIRNQWLYPYFDIDTYLVTQGENITIDKWIGYHPDKIWGKEHREYAFPYLFIDPQILTTGESITLDKWFRELDRQAFRYKATPHLYPYLSWYNKIIILPTLIQGSNAHVIFPQVFQYQQLTRPIDRPPETITLDKWIGEKPVYIWDKKRQQYSFQFFFMFDKFVYSIWVPVDENDAEWTKSEKPTGNYVLVAKSEATFTKTGKSTATWTKTEGSSSTWTKAEKQPNLIEVP